MTIEELSIISGVSSRNIRAFQSKALLPAPTMRLRAGFYNEGHLARLKLITSMQKQGFSLTGIAELLGAWEKGKSLDEVLGFESIMDPLF
ncbi:MerR family transcriptional regulator [Deltaproteobacteria bacterium TL4]